jgi:phage protein D
MAATPLLEVSARHDAGLYAPEVEVRIEGVGLPRSVVRDISRVVYHDCIERIDSFELTVTNWDDDAGVFKYIGAETAGNVQGGSTLARRHQLFEPSDKPVELRMGYVGALEPMMTGTITTMQPSFSSTAGASLTVSCLNSLHQLRRKPYTTMFRDRKDSEIAEQLATLSDEGHKRFPIPIRIDEEAKNHEEAIPFVAQDNQYDIDFLYTRAKRLGYVIYVDHREGGPELYFGPSQSASSEVVHSLEWGKEITSFQPRLTAANQVRAVTVRGWNRDTQQPISETATLSDPRIDINRDLHRILEAVPREEQVVHEPLFTVREARERAVNLLLNRQRQMVHASISTLGLPQLRAGRRVAIVGLGARLSGTYFITDSTHIVCAEAGYTTRLEARREHRGGAA